EAEAQDVAEEGDPHHQPVADACRPREQDRGEEEVGDHDRDAVTDRHGAAEAPHQRRQRDGGEREREAPPHHVESDVTLRRGIRRRGPERGVRHAAPPGGGRSPSSPPAGTTSGGLSSTGAGVRTMPRRAGTAACSSRIWWSYSNQSFTKTPTTPKAPSASISA